MEVKERLRKLQEDFRRNSKIIKHSTPLTYYADGPQLDFRDVILAGIISGRNVLLNGGTGIAKTHISLLALGSIFGDNYGILQIDPSLNEEKLYNINFEAVKCRKLTDLYEPTLLITAPGVLLDETNRAPPAILNHLQAYLNNQATTPGGGKVQPTGVELEDSMRYQFKIGTCNEGKRYGESTWKMDPAFRRRFSIEIPLNLFTPTERDNMERIQMAAHTGVPVAEKCDNLEHVLYLHNELKKVELHPLVHEFLGYLSRMNNCIKSPYFTKMEEGFAIERCEGCHARGTAGEENFCGNCYAPSSSTQIDLKAVSQAFAMLRAYHSKDGFDNLEVELCDVEQAFPLVASTKLGFDPAWLRSYFKSGEPHQAARALTVNIEQRITGKVAKLQTILTHDNLTPEDMRIVKKYGEEDPWGIGLRDTDYN